MRNYNELYITYSVKNQQEIEKALPDRAKVSGGCCGPGFEITTSTAYEFEPPLTLNEIVGLTARLISLDVKNFRFSDVASLGKDD